MAIELDEQVTEDVNMASRTGHPMIFVGVTPEGEPTVSFRGSAQVLGKDRLAFWARKGGDSTLVNSLATHPTVVAVYSNMPERRFYQFKGKARLVSTEPDRTTVYDNAPDFERNADPEKKGDAVIIELESVRGRGKDGMVMMARE
jgi:hypothetical protein